MKKVGAILPIQVLESAGNGKVDVFSNLRELMGMVAGYHQPYDYLKSEIANKLLGVGIPSTVAYMYIVDTVVDLRAVILRCTNMHIHYMTHMVYVEGESLLIAELISKETDIERMAGFTMEDEIKWAVTYG